LYTSISVNAFVLYQEITCGEILTKGLYATIKQDDEQKQATENYKMMLKLLLRYQTKIELPNPFLPTPKLLLCRRSLLIWLLSCGGAKRAPERLLLVPVQREGDQDETRVLAAKEQGGRNGFGSSIFV